MSGIIYGKICGENEEEELNLNKTETRKMRFSCVCYLKKLNAS